MRKLVQRNIELLKRNFELDEQKKIFQITLKAHSLEELIDGAVSTPSVITLNSYAENFLVDYLEDIPKGYRCDLKLEIDDYLGYSPDLVMDAFVNVLKVNLVRFEKENRRKWRTVAGMIVLGLILVILGKTVFTSVFSNPTANDVISEVFDIAGWVFLWEAVTVIFLNPSEILHKGRLFAFKVHSFSLTDSEGKILDSHNRSWRI